MTLRRTTTLTLAVCLPLALSCGDGTPAFCEPLENTADLSSLGGALEAVDLDRAASEAQRLRDLADEAPPEIRADLVALADGVVDVVDLIATERGASSGPAGAADPGEVERQRDQLTDRLGELDRRSDRISAWAAEQCGLDLS